MGGLATYGKQQALAGVLANGTEYFAGFLTTLPSDDAGTGLVEATGSGYVRKGHSAWMNIDESPEWYRVNNGAIEFAALSADLDDCVGWGIWTAVSGGTLIAWGPLLDVGENEITKKFTSGNQPRFVDQELKVGVD
jgi:hypothetical protein